jgi:RNA polymerase sigma factor (sigma-70 family)
MDEQALIHEAQGGSLDAFNTLILHYQDSIFNTALRILGDEDLAADATQEAFLSAFKSISSFRGGSFKAWLMRTVTNACYDELRRQKRRPTTPLEPDTDDGEEMDSPRWLADPGSRNSKPTSSSTPSSTASTTSRWSSKRWWSWQMSRDWITVRWRSPCVCRWAPSRAAWHVPD